MRRFDVNNISRIYMNERHRGIEVIMPNMLVQPIYGIYATYEKETTLRVERSYDRSYGANALLNGERIAKYWYSGKKCYVTAFGSIFEAGIDQTDREFITYVRPLVITALKDSSIDLDYYKLLMNHPRRHPDKDAFVVYTHPEIDKHHRRSEFRGAAYVYRKYFKPEIKGFEVVKRDPEFLLKRPEMPTFRTERGRREKINLEVKQAFK